MRQHCKKRQGSNKKKRQWVWERGLALYKEMENKPSPMTKSIRRRLFAQMRDQARREYAV